MKYPFEKNIVNKNSMAIDREKYITLNFLFDNPPSTIYKGNETRI
jgi:uncharacterized membrane-anchored protein